ncbi:hypothetical protein V5O48_012812 [Marasmius crinis-equi]|uniref:Gfd2/YDR514C-like C-terminal domain-containing protein n=1 Tax=Marasmius crinis-equi TaxID=585013 RepID=A0ABR3F1S9_9AGAR
MAPGIFYSYNRTRYHWLREGEVTTGSRRHNVLALLVTGALDANGHPWRNADDTKISIFTGWKVEEGKGGDNYKRRVLLVSTEQVERLVEHVGGWDVDVERPVDSLVEGPDVFDIKLQEFDSEDALKATNKLYHGDKKRGPVQPRQNKNKKQKRDEKAKAQLQACVDLVKEPCAFLALDYEWVEGNTEAVTELGLVVMYNDKIIRDRQHWRIMEHQDLRVHKFAKAKVNEEGWSFGESQVVPEGQLASMLQGVFQQEARNASRVCVVVQGGAIDIRITSELLNSAEFTPTELSLRETSKISWVDVSELFTFQQQLGNAASLRYMCLELGVDGDDKNFHNAGNDADFIMRCFIAIVAKASA